MVPVVRHCVGAESTSIRASSLSMMTAHSICSWAIEAVIAPIRLACVARASSTLANCKASWVGQCTLFTFYEKAVPVSSTAIFGGSDLAT